MYSGGLILHHQPLTIYFYWEWNTIKMIRSARFQTEESEDWAIRFILGEGIMIRTSGTIFREEERDSDLGVGDGGGSCSAFRFVPRDCGPMFVLLGDESSSSSSLSVSIGSCEGCAVDFEPKRVLIVNVGSSF